MLYPQLYMAVFWWCPCPTEKAPSWQGSAVSRQGMVAVCLADPLSRQLGRLA